RESLDRAGRFLHTATHMVAVEPRPDVRSAGGERDDGRSPLIFQLPLTTGLVRQPIMYPPRIEIRRVSDEPRVVGRHERGVELPLEEWPGNSISGTRSCAMGYGLSAASRSRFRKRNERAVDGMDVDNIGEPSLRA